MGLDLCRVKRCPKLTSEVPRVEETHKSYTKGLLTTPCLRCDKRIIYWYIYCWFDLPWVFLAALSFSVFHFTILLMSLSSALKSPFAICELYLSFLYRWDCEYSVVSIIKLRSSTSRHRAGLSRSLWMPSTTIYFFTSFLLYIALISMFSPTDGAARILP